MFWRIKARIVHMPPAKQIKRPAKQIKKPATQAAKKASPAKTKPAAKKASPAKPAAKKAAGKAMLFAPATGSDVDLKVRIKAVVAILEDVPVSDIKAKAAAALLQDVLKYL